MISEERLYELFGFYEENRFFHIQDVGSMYIMCYHEKPFRASFNQNEGIMYPDRMTVSKLAVELQPYYYKDGTGHAGQCKVCGKVYYR